MNFALTVFFVLCSLLFADCALSCSATWECASVTENFNYVECEDNQCRCLNELGFEGDATSSDPCSCAGEVYWGKGTPYCKICEPPRKIFYEDGVPYCVDLAAAEAAHTEAEIQEIRKNVVRQVYERLLFPTPQLVVSGILPVTDLFDENVVRGRVSPVGEFFDFLAVEEYFYALGLSSPIININIKSLISTGDKVAVDVDILFNNSQAGLRNLTQMGFYTFNEKNLIISHDLVILNLGKAQDTPPEANPLIIQQLCAGIAGPEGFCPPETDPEGFYTDFEDCVNFMSSIPFGTWDQAASNTTTCRQLHFVLVPFRPNIHCPHVGKAGGGKCIDVPYEDFYTKEF